MAKLIEKAEALWQVKQKAREVYSHQLLSKSLEDSVKAEKKSLLGAMDDGEFDRATFEFIPTAEELDMVPTAEHKNVTVSVNQRVSIDYDPIKVEGVIESKLGRSVARTIVRRTYKVNDWSALVAWAKTQGINPEEFLGFFDVERTVDTSALDKAYETGSLYLEDFEGAYEVKRGEPYLSFRGRKA